jgi:hypothetical protein
VRAVQEKDPDASRLFEAVSKMAADPDAPSHYRELGRVLQSFMSGVKHPDLSRLPEELARMVREELEGGGSSRG